MDPNEIRVRLWALINDPAKKDEFNLLWHKLMEGRDGGQHARR